MPADGILIRSGSREPAPHAASLSAPDLSTAQEGQCPKANWTTA